MKHGEVYEHYKQVNYTFMGITTALAEDVIDFTHVVKIKATNEATLEEVDVYEMECLDDKFIYYADLPFQHVLYQSHKDGRLWLRNPSDFFGPIAPNSPLRFTLIGE